MWVGVTPLYIYLSRAKLYARNVNPFLLSQVPIKTLLYLFFSNWGTPAFETKRYPAADKRSSTS